MILLALWQAAVTAGAAEQEPVAAAIIGRFAKGPVGSPVEVSAGEFADLYGSDAPTGWPAELQARRFFVQGASKLNVIRTDPDGPLSTALAGDPAAMSGLHALPLVRDLGMLLCPEITLLPTAEVKPALAIWKAELAKRRAMMILDPPPGMTSSSLIAQWVTQHIPAGSKELALYYPYLTASVNGTPATFGASGQMAAAWLANDLRPDDRIWSAPAGTRLPLVADGTSPLRDNTTSMIATDAYICVIRQFTAGGPILPWAARHLDGGNPENRHIPVQRATDWTQADIEAHVVKLNVGVALLLPAEFTILRFQWNTRNPARPLEAPRLLMRDGFAGKQLFYKSPPGASYTLKSSPSLAGWTQYAAPVPGDNTWRRVAFVPEAGKRFFRVEQTPLP